MIGHTHATTSTTYQGSSTILTNEGPAPFVSPYVMTKREEKQEQSRVALADAIDHEPQPAGDEPANDTDTHDDRVTETNVKLLPFSLSRSPTAGAATRCGGRI